jgi:predicted DCC family thiol-disulfide oxidoreductase YuxK
MSTLGLTDEDGLKQVWFVDINGRLTGGAEAVNRAVRYCWWVRPFTYLYFLPGIRQVQDWAYRWVAENRYRLPGSTPQCALPSQEVKSVE